jgi:flavin reductase (DIM6/NTAB) family NADH-FMN oxidoreductase RutF
MSMHEFDPADRPPSDNKRVVQCLVSPRPIAWISTADANGCDNLAPFSSYNYVSARRPVVGFNTPNADHGGLKDTARNALDTGEFAVNVVTEKLIDEMDHTSASLARNESEFDLADVAQAPCQRIDVPRVRDAVATMECTLLDSVKIHDRVMILGDVRYVHLAEETMTDGDIDMRNLDTVGRLGGPYYTVSDPVSIDRRYS